MPEPGERPSLLPSPEQEKTELSEIVAKVITQFVNERLPEELRNRTEVINFFIHQYLRKLHIVTDNASYHKIRERQLGITVNKLSRFAFALSQTGTQAFLTEVGNDFIIKVNLENKKHILHELSHLADQIIVDILKNALRQKDDDFTAQNEKENKSNEGIRLRFILSLFTMLASPAISQGLRINASLLGETFVQDALPFLLTLSFLSLSTFFVSYGQYLNLNMEKRAREAEGRVEEFFGKQQASRSDKKQQENVSPLNANSIYYS
jgi:hypothetical protein